jgi:hypothetical protein
MAAFHVTLLNGMIFLIARNAIAHLDEGQLRTLRIMPPHHSAAKAESSASEKS